LQPLVRLAGLGEMMDVLRNRAIQWSVVAAVLVGALVAWRLHAKNVAEAEAAAYKPPPARVTVIRAAPGEIANAVSITGIISAKNDLPIGPEGEGGRITAVLVDVGQRVRRGQLLARVEPGMAESQVAAATAAFEDARASAAAAQAELARAERARDSFSVEELERRRTAANTAAARVSVATAQMKQARTNWGRTNVVAPSAGVVLTRNAEVGQIASGGGGALFHIAQDGELEMRGQVSEQEMPRLKVGQSVEVYVTGVAAPYSGKVWQLGAVIDAVSRQGSVRVLLPGEDSNLRPGAFARATVQAGSSMGVLVPQTALQSDAGSSYVLVVDGESRVQRRAVSVAGARAEGLLVSSGLQDNDRVVAIAGAFLRDGETVNAIESGVAAAAGVAGPGVAGSGTAHGSAAASGSRAHAEHAALP
jgi:RND family efflux transporter MFP subunit